MNILQQTILTSLRNGDTVVRWNDSQFLLLLPFLNSEQAEDVISRIKIKFLDVLHTRDVTINYSIQMINHGIVISSETITNAQS